MQSSRTLSTLLLFVILSMTFGSLPGQWNPDPAQNLAICTSTDKQIDLRMTSDGKGGAFIAWKDYRNFSVPDIFVQRVNAAGMPLWTTDGVAICTDPYDQSTPAIVDDMAGGAIIAWSDWRSGIERDLYAQRVDSNGNVLWTIDGVGVANKVEREHNEKIISDDAGGAIIVWEQQSNVTFQWDIWAQRINPSGQPLWPVGGVPVCTVDANRLNPKVQADGRHGAIITWEDFRSGWDYDIYAQRMGANGNRLWGDSARVICSATNAQTNPKIDPDTTIGGAFIVWTDKRNGMNYDLYAQRIDSLGVTRWQNNGMPVVLAGGNQSAQDILSSKDTKGLIVCWKDKRGGDFDIYAQKLDFSGAPQWAVNGVPLCTSMYDQVNPNIVTDRNGGAIVVWQDSSDGTWNARSQRIDSSGSVVWMANGVLVGSATDNQVSPKNISDGSGGSIYAFQDKRTGEFDIYAHHLFADGAAIVNRENHSTPAFALQAYPNPFSGNLHIRWKPEDGQEAQMQIFSMDGRCIHSQGISPGETLLNGESVLGSSGIYLLSIRSGNNAETLRIHFAR